MVGVQWLRRADPWPVSTSSTGSPPTRHLMQMPALHGLPNVLSTACSSDHQPLPALSLWPSQLQVSRFPHCPHPLAQLSCPFLPWASSPGVVADSVLKISVASSLTSLAIMTLFLLTTFSLGKTYSLHDTRAPILEPPSSNRQPFQAVLRPGRPTKWGEAFSTEFCCWWVGVSGPGQGVVTGMWPVLLKILCAMNPLLRGRLRPDTHWLSGGAGP